MEENEVLTPGTSEPTEATGEPEEKPAEQEQETETTDTNTDAATSDTSNATDVVFIDPSPVTTYDGGMYEIDLVHTITLGDFLISTLLCILIVVQLLGRLLGGR